MIRKAAGCVVIKNDSILLLHRTDKDWLELPGGKSEPNEEVSITAAREFREEIGASVKIIRKLGSTIFKSVEFELDYTWFLAELEKDAELKIQEPESFDKFEFVPIKDLRSHSLSTNMQNFVLAIEDGNMVL